MKQELKIYQLWQDENTGYYTYDSCVVCAYDIEDAKTIAPDGDVTPAEKNEDTYSYGWWASSTKTVYAEEIGIANDKQTRGVICASFNGE
jgi:hypothetical protein